MAEDYNAASPAGESKSVSPWVVIAIIIGVMVCCCIIIFVMITVASALLGPSVGNVFSNIIEEIATPVP